MAKNVYTKWDPLPDLPTTFFCDAVHDDYEGFRVILRAEGGRGPIIRISFESVLAYRNIDEGDRARTIMEAGSFKDSSLYIVSDSTWLEWFRTESLGVRDRHNITHYAVYTPNDFIDILSQTEPIVEILS